MGGLWKVPLRSIPFILLSHTYALFVVLRCSPSTLR